MKIKFEFRGSALNPRHAGIALAIVVIGGLLFAFDPPLPPREGTILAIGLSAIAVSAAISGFSRMVEIDIHDRRIKITRLWFGRRINTILDVSCDDGEAILIKHRASTIGLGGVRWPHTIAFLVLKSGRRYRVPVFHDGDSWIMARKLATGLGELTGLPLIFDPPELAGPTQQPLIEPFWRWPDRLK